MKNCLAFLESNTTGSGDAFLARSTQLGYRPLLLCADPARYPAVPPGVEVVSIDTSAGVEPLARQLRAHAPVGVLTTSSYYGLPAAQLAEALHLPGPGSVAMQLGVHKHHQREALRAHGVPQPAYRFCTTAQDALRAAEELAYPLVVKPVEGSGKVGVSLTRDASELAAWAGQLTGPRRNERGASVAEGFLVEEFFPGREFSVECFHGQPLALVEKSCRPPRFVEESHVTPPDGLTDAGRRALEQLAADALRALGLGWGPAHVEARLSPAGQAVIIEVNARLAGGNIPQLVALATGLDLITATIRAAVGQPPALDFTERGAAAIAFVFAPSAGTVRAVNGLESARALPGVRIAESYRRPGDTIRLWGDFRDRVAYAIAGAESPAQALNRARDGAATIQLKMEIES